MRGNRIIIAAAVIAVWIVAAWTFPIEATAGPAHQTDGLRTLIHPYPAAHAVVVPQAPPVAPVVAPVAPDPVPVAVAPDPAPVVVQTAAPVSVPTDTTTTTTTPASTDDYCILTYTGPQYNYNNGTTVMVTSTEGVACEQARDDQATYGGTIQGPMPTPPSP